MDIRVKDAIYLQVEGHDYMVRPSTVGTEKKRIVYFPDNTRTVLVGFSRELCLENNLFSVNRTITDKDISLKDAIKAIEQSPLDKEVKDNLIFQLSAL